ncbi:MAG: hypothetical protein AB1656_13480 [Candidatus Omnitrophota bacterium]
MTASSLTEKLLGIFLIFTENQTIKYILMPPDPADANQDGVFSGNANEAEITGLNISYCPKPAPGKQAPMNTGLSYQY